VYFGIFEGGAPLLSSVCVSGISLHCCWPPLTAIATLTLDGDVETDLLLEYRRFVEMLRALQSLVHLSLDGPVFIVDVGAGIITAELPLLRSFEVTTEDYQYALTDVQMADYLSILFNTITAPGLDTLILSTTTLDQNTTLVHCLRPHQVSPKFPVLRSLEFSPIKQAITNAELMSAIQSLEHLQFIRIACHRYAGCLRDRRQPVKRASCSTTLPSSAVSDH
jgi:hypothetical protein